MDKEISILIRPDGTAKIETKNFQGQKCEKVIEKYRQHMKEKGIVIQDLEKQLKSEDIKIEATPERNKLLLSL